MRKHQITIFFIFSILLLTACAPTKNTATRRFYHNLVSRYNIYHNGKEALRTGQDQLQKNHKDDYTQILEILPYGSEGDANAIIPLMDRAAEKGSKLVLKHSMFFKTVEYNKWVDDSYMLIGKARFFKRDYLAAIEMFDFVSKRFTKSPIKYDALLWMAKAYLYSGRFAKCDAIFGMIEPNIAKGETSTYVARYFPIVKAQYCIKTGNLEEAATYLEKALQGKQKRKLKIRINFVAGQVNQKLGRNEVALKYYQDCLQLNPPYDIAFHAKIFSAECYDAGMGGGENILKELYKMLKDPKNKEYFDEIYYALANIELKNENRPKAIEFLLLSARSSISNTTQKGLSYLKLGELHFEMREWDEAKMFYDSTVAFLPKTYPNFAGIQEKAEILTRLITSLQTIELQDSLQRLAAMSERELNATIDKIIADLIKKEEEEKRLQQEQQMAAMQQKDPNMQMTNAPGSAWYFYNPPAVNYGKTEFMRIWGNRKLEDFWRLKDKEVVAFIDPDNPDTQTDPAQQDSIAKMNNPKERAFYLKDIPDTPEKIEASNLKIKNAYFMAGSTYKDELKDFPPAIEMFEELLKRFPASEFELQALYSLYILNKNLNKSADADRYKQRILNDYPDSDFAKIISDPDYFLKIAQQASEVKQFYSETYQLFQNAQYSQVIANADSAKVRFNDPELIPKFEYLKALSLAKVDTRDALIEQLKHIITNYPSSEVKPMAEELLAYLESGAVPDTSGIVQDGGVTDGQLYMPSPQSYHLFVLIVDVKTANMNSIRSLLSDHNANSFSTKNLSVSSLFITDLRHLLTVSRFNNQEDAEQYYKVFITNSELQQAIQNTNPVFFVISTDNYPAFYKDKDEQAYLDFFRRNYLKN